MFGLVRRKEFRELEYRLQHIERDFNALRDLSWSLEMAGVVRRKRDSGDYYDAPHNVGAELDAILDHLGLEVVEIEAQPSRIALVPKATEGADDA